ncbi:hypothetical protein T11_14337 [Trichinella zimbabwensis]|uniref:Uncharacterized protein n=1 Tax=Trichinella zimbabwensis TaxID=268475 RepID=A0A0V1GMR8_9BILA|nr:hypothetical protein T11_14337 [Trichinella zimbabwensis]
MSHWLSLRLFPTSLFNKSVGQQFIMDISDFSLYKVCLLHHWISIEFDLAAMDYISALEQVWSHSATAV